MAIFDKMTSLPLPCGLLLASFPVYLILAKLGCANGACGVPFYELAVPAEKRCLFPYVFLAGLTPFVGSKTGSKNSTFLEGRDSQMSAIPF